MSTKKLNSMRLLEQHDVPYEAISYGEPDAFHDAVEVAEMIGVTVSMVYKTLLVEPVGGAIGAGVVSLAEPLMPLILGMAAGAMLFVISDEIIPETHRRGYENVATFSLLGGFVVMMFLDTVFA